MIVCSCRERLPGKLSWKKEAKNSVVVHRTITSDLLDDPFVHED